MSYRRALLLSAVSIGLPRALFAQHTEDVRFIETLGSLRRLRATSEETAALVKGGFASTTTQYIKSRRLYGRARAEVEEVAGLLRQAVLSGNENAIRQNPNLLAAAERASLETTELLTYVDQVLEKPPKRAASIVAIVGALSSIAALALELLKVADMSTGLSNKLEERRKRRADEIEGQIVWKTWSSIDEKKP